jgi:DNA-binding transcriptional ArsR family regulator
MADRPDLAAIAALLADPTRAAMIGLLMDGRAQTATELSLEGGVTPSTASVHLARLTRAGLLTLEKQGRHRYFRIARREVGAAIEGLMTISPRRRTAAAGSGPREEGLRRARVCYDHLAGERGVRLFDGLRKRRLLAGTDDRLSLTAEGESWCARLGIDLAGLRRRRRPLCRACLDWSERRAHLAGALGAALLDRLFALRYARRADDDRRAVSLSPRGEAFIERLDPGR